MAVESLKLPLCNAACLLQGSLTSPPPLLSTTLATLAGGRPTRARTLCPTMPPPTLTTL